MFGFNQVVLSSNPAMSPRPVDCHPTNGCPSPRSGMWAPCHQFPPSPALMSSTNPKVVTTPTNSATSSQEGKQRGGSAGRTIGIREESRTSRDCVKPTRCLVVLPPPAASTTRRHGKLEPHAALIIFPLASKKRQCGVLTPPFFPSFLWYR